MARHNEEVIMEWMAWCVYKSKYGHMFSTELKIPVPAEVEAIYLSNRDIGRRMLDWYDSQVAAGHRFEFPPPVPAPPTNMVTRSMAQGATTTSTGQAAWRGFKEEGTRQLKKGLFSLLTRRW